MENFKEIKDYENSYLIGDQGSVKSLLTNKILKQSKGNSGYFQVCLSKDRKIKSIMVHRLVAKAFLPLKEGKRIVNHKNGVKTDNRVENLEWCTHSENSKHANTNGLAPNPPNWAKGKFGFEHNRSKAVIQLDVNKERVKIFGSLLEAGRQLNADHTAIWYCIKKKAFNKQTNSYFEYANE